MAFRNNKKRFREDGEDETRAWGPLINMAVAGALFDLAK